MCLFFLNEKCTAEFVNLGVGTTEMLEMQMELWLQNWQMLNNR